MEFSAQVSAVLAIRGKTQLSEKGIRERMMTERMMTEQGQHKRKEKDRPRRHRFKEQGSYIMHFPA